MGLGRAAWPAIPRCGKLRVVMLLAVLLVAPAQPWEWSARVGAQLDGAPHGVLDLGLRRGPYSVELQTDTLELRWEQRGAAGLGWAAVRAQAGAAALLISPWSNGAPDPTRSLLGFAVGAEGGWLGDLGGGAYAGLEVGARQYLFRANDGTRIAVPEATRVVTWLAQLGYARGGLHAKLRGGVELEDLRAAPRIDLAVELHPKGVLAPRLELRAGLAADQSYLTRTRLGGLNPYVVPLAGAGWAEFWVERFLALRAGPELRLGPFTVALVLDGARFDRGDQAGLPASPGSAWGAALLSSLALGPVEVEAQGGIAPELPRGEGLGRWSLWLSASYGWAAL